MRIPGYGPIRNLIDDRRARRYVASLDRSEYVVPDGTTTEMAEKLRAMLDDNIVPFWFPACIDEEHGGYLAECSISGEWQLGRHKNLISQSRILWFAARLIDFGRTSEDNLYWARHGFDILKNHFLDMKHGGFFWEVDGRSGAPTMPGKHLCGQAYALYALTEFAEATGNRDARTMADDLFEVLDAHAHDDTYSGYREFFTVDWQDPDPDKPSYMGYPAGAKQFGTHVHLMEAFTRYAQMAEGALIRERLAELVRIQSETAVTEEGGGCTDLYSRDWGRWTSEPFNEVMYGHDLENVWMLIDANRVLGRDGKESLSLYEALFLNAVRYGWDVSSSGFYFGGKLLKRAHRRTKSWWVQAEAMLSALHMYSLSGQAMYFEIFSRTLDWIDRHQIDRQGGEWFARIDTSGVPAGSKATDATSRWKTPYHNGRAVIHCLELLGDTVP